MPGPDEWNPAQIVNDLTTDVIRARRLIRWLSLTYGENVPVFHGQYREELSETYLTALDQDDGDPAFAYAAEVAMSRPDPDGDFGTPPGQGAYAEHDRLMADRGEVHIGTMEFRRVAPRRHRHARRRWWRR